MQPILHFGLGWLGFIIGAQLDIRLLDRVPRGTAYLIVVEVEAGREHDDQGVEVHGPGDLGDDDAQHGREQGVAALDLLDEQAEDHADEDADPGGAEQLPAHGRDRREDL